MNIPLSVLWEIALILVGFILGTLWGHHAAIGKRVTYADCSKKRENCPCIADIKEVKARIDIAHPPSK